MFLSFDLEAFRTAWKVKVVFCPASLALSRALVNFVRNHLRPQAIAPSKPLRSRRCATIFGFVLGLWRNCVLVF